MKKAALLPLITFDVVVNVYLTTLFLIPVVKIARGRAQQSHHALRSMAIKTFFGSCATLISSVTNLTTLMLLKGEPGWICLLLCNADILFSAVVLHTITNKDHQGSSDTTRATNDYASQNEATITGNATDLGTRRSSIAKGHRSSVATNTAFIGPQLAPMYENDPSDPSSEKSIATSETTERKDSRTWLFGRNSRNQSKAAESQFNPELMGSDRLQNSGPEVSRSPSMAVNVRSLSEYAEYDSGGLDFITAQQVAGDSSSNGEDALSDKAKEAEERHEKHEERAPHRLV
ncbi:hypothetical protein TWF718_008546 [Orbilia javanica]|uniref:Uncharacterized protein n=1 Tax=Orbilia javanica TaxID=47235 RepID=A0AAN8MYI6_9PEZI